LGRLYREIIRKVEENSIDINLDAKILLKQCKQLYTQKRNSKNHHKKLAWQPTKKK